MADLSHLSDDDLAKIANGQPHVSQMSDAELEKIASSVAAPQAPSKFDLKTLTDVAESGLSGLGQGVAGLAGLPGDISNAMTSGLTGLANMFTKANIQPVKSPLSGDVLSQDLSNAVGGYHEPQTVAGEYARTIGQFAPGMVAGPEGAIPRIASAVVPAVASEAAGQATKGTTLEPAARIAGALLAPVGVGLIKRTGASIANALSKTAPVSVVDEVAPNVQELHDIATENYDVLKNPETNPIISQNAVQRLRDAVQTKLTDEAFHPSDEPAVGRLFDRINSTAETHSTLSDLEKIRQYATKIGGNFTTSDGQLANKVKAVITDFMANLDPEKDIIGTEATGPLQVPGPTAAGVTSVPGLAQLQAARPAYATYIKSKIIQSIIDNADIRGAANYSQAGADQALQRGFANLATNSKKMAQFNPKEQEAIKLAAMGSAGQNVLKLFSKLAVRGPVSGAATTVLGHAFGPAGPYVLAGIGEAAKRGAASATDANVNALSALVRGGPGAAQKLQDIRTAKMLQMLKSYSAPAAGVIGYAAQPALAGNQ